MNGEISLPVTILTAVAFIFFLAANILPMMNPAGTLIGLDGAIGFIDHSDIWNGLDPISAFFYYFGDLICHQEESRSMIINGNQMFVCMRDYCLLAGFTIVMVALFRNSIKDASLDRMKKWVLGVLIALTPIEWIVEQSFDLDLYAPRVIAAILTGGAIAYVAVHLIMKATSVETKGFEGE